MNTAEIQRTQRRVGTPDDGFWGPKSIAACQKHLRSLMPKPHPFPGTSQAALTNFYGAPGDEDKHLSIEPPYRMWLYEQGGPIQTRITVHQRCAISLLKVLQDIAKVYPTDSARLAAGVSLYFGVYNNRPMVNGTLPSLHARAAAIDFDANRNKNLSHWPMKSTMPIEVMECFARHGWLSAGAFWSRDAMHFQATQ